MSILRNLLRTTALLAVMSTVVVFALAAAPVPRDAQVPTALHSAIEATRNAVEPDGAGFKASNPKQHLELRFETTAASVRLPDAEVRLRLAGYGPGSQLARPAAATLTAAGNRVEYRERILPHETVHFGYLSTSYVPLGTRSADSTATGRFPLPPYGPGVPYGTGFIRAAGQRSGLSGMASFFATPHLIMNPSAGPVGSSAVAQGFGFGAGETVYIYWKTPSVYWGEVSADSTGSFYRIRSGPGHPGYQQRCCHRAMTRCAPYRSLRRLAPELTGYSGSSESTGGHTVVLAKMESAM